MKKKLIILIGVIIVIFGAIIVFESLSKNWKAEKIGFSYDDELFSVNGLDLDVTNDYGRVSFNEGKIIIKDKSILDGVNDMTIYYCFTESSCIIENHLKSEEQLTIDTIKLPVFRSMDVDGMEIRNSKNREDFLHNLDTFNIFIKLSGEKKSNFKTYKLDLDYKILSSDRMGHYKLDGE